MAAWLWMPEKILHSDNWLYHATQFKNACLTLYIVKKTNDSLPFCEVGTVTNITNPIALASHFSNNVDIAIFVCAGYSLENLLKAILCIVKKDDFSKTLRPQWTTTHDLTKLSSMCNYQPSSKQKSLLVWLHHMIVSGKYPPLLQNHDYIYLDAGCREKAVNAVHTAFRMFRNDLDEFIKLFYQTHDELMQMLDEKRS